MKWTQCVALGSGIAALSMNLILLPFIVYKSSIRMGVYKYFLLAYVLCAATFAACQIAILPTWYIPHNGFLFQSTSTLLPRFIQQILLHIVCATFLGICIIIMWCFLFRYFVILNSKPWLIRYPYLQLSLAFSIGVLGYYFSICYPLEPTETYDLLFREPVLKSSDVEVSEIAYIGAQLMIEGEVNSHLLLCLLSYLVFDVAYFWTMGICWFLTGRKLRKLSRMGTASRSHYKYQYRLYTLLTIQTFFPMVFNGMPAFSVFSISVLGIHVGDEILLCGMVITFAQVIDPIMTLYMITDYRDPIIRSFRVFTKSKVDVGQTGVSGSQRLT